MSARAAQSSTPPWLQTGQRLKGDYDKARKACIERAVRDISPAALKVWFVLGDFCRQQDEWETCYPSVAAIAKRSGFSERHVTRLIRELEVGGWIGVKRRPDRNSLYWMPKGFPSMRRWYALAVMGSGEYPREATDD